ncbi:MAG: hypothetical protein GEU96_17250 [Propionibacteriales bacterium]|nr:hypothetical protein [Propionibacteriales bacterium]
MQATIASTGSGTIEPLELDLVEPNAFRCLRVDAADVVAGCAEGGDEPAERSAADLQHARRW